MASLASPVSLAKLLALLALRVPLHPVCLKLTPLPVLDLQPVLNRVQVIPTLQASKAKPSGVALIPAPTTQIIGEDTTGNK